jgi:hypothetical protein
MTADLTPSPPGDVPPADSGSSLAEEPINLTAVETLPAVPAQTIRRAAPYDPEPQRERLRGWIALGLLGILAAVLLLTFISMWLGMEAEMLQTVLTIIFGPLVTLVSAATGFYYGSRSSAS